MKKTAFIFFLLLAAKINAQHAKVYPSNWWTGMNNPKLQLLLHAKFDIADETIQISYPGVRVDKITPFPNKHYTAIDLTITPEAKPGTMFIECGKNKKLSRIPFELMQRHAQNGKTRVQGVSAADLVYLIMPDRFVNGDSSNDVVSGMRDTISDRNNMYARHGGDLKGIRDHLDYFNDLGVTALWLTPVIENDMPVTEEGGTRRSAYHGYAFTDHYHADARLGGNKAYKELIEAMHSKGLKIIQDAVYNHVGASHWFILDLPMRDWLNEWPVYTQTSYKDQPLLDPHGSAADRKLSNDGWFTSFMPDLNQRNPYVANFLVQHAIWSTEYFGIDGWRVDTYFYSDPAFLNRINDALIAEFPSLTLFGEAWVHTVTSSAYFCRNNMDVSFKHNLQGVTDFPLHFAFIDGVNQAFGWTEGVSRLYSTLAQDILYKDPTRNAIFLDNHDLDRIYSVTGEDLGKMKTLVTWLLTLRGIPQLYYGTEILMKNFKDPSDAKVREDFPGGWPQDTSNKFTASGRTDQENAFFDFVKKLAHFRKSSSALTTGKLMQFVPADGVYVYFRYNEQQTIAVVSNTSKEAKTVASARFAERTGGFSYAKNVITGDTIASEIFSIPAGTTWVLELQK